MGLLWALHRATWALHRATSFTEHQLCPCPLVRQTMIRGGTEAPVLSTTPEVCDMKKLAVFGLVAGAILAVILGVRKRSRPSLLRSVKSGRRGSVKRCSRRCRREWTPCQRTPTRGDVQQRGSHSGELGANPRTPRRRSQRHRATGQLSGQITAADQQRTRPYRLRFQGVIAGPRWMMRGCRDSSFPTRSVAV